MNYNEVVPFLAVQDIGRSLSFYVQELGFEIKNKWEVQGKIKWCMIGLEKIHFMLQQFDTEGEDAKTFEGKKGAGVRFCVFCEDSLGMYRQLISKNASVNEPVVGNGYWIYEDQSGTTPPTIVDVSGLPKEIQKVWMKFQSISPFAVSEINSFSPYFMIRPMDPGHGNAKTYSLYFFGKKALGGNHRRLLFAHERH